MAKYTREELVAFQEKVKDYKQEDFKKLSEKELGMLQFLQCPFCQIIDGMIPSKVIFEDDKIYAILDINPATPGHILLMPKEHYQISPQVPKETMEHLGVISKKLSNACLIGLKCKGTTTLISNGGAAGQKSPHFMINIIPRYDEDNLNNFGCIGKKANEKEIESMANSLKQYISKKLGISVPEKKIKEKPKDNKVEEKVEKKEEENKSDKKEVKEESEKNKVENRLEEKDSELEDLVEKEVPSKKQEEKKSDKKVNLDQISKLF